MIGVEMDIDVASLIKAGHERGLLMINAGPDVLRLLPPLIIQETHIDQFIGALQNILTETVSA
jgi:acetylornithine/N-succinyldiaminopimelate aminotransferase